MCAHAPDSIYNSIWPLRGQDGALIRTRFQIKVAAGPKAPSRPAGEAVCPLDSAASHGGSIPGLTHFIAGLIHWETNRSNHLYSTSIKNVWTPQLLGFRSK